jgi:2-polyprenyl-6-hydroxyphenyl methylase/3-demethylubiquinone-9 3-methyltransferase
MWLAIDNAIGRVVRPNGKLFIAIYNDQGWKSHVWWLVKSFYNRLPRFLKKPFVAAVAGATQLLVIAKYTLKLQPMTAIRPLLKDRRERGMSAKYDRVDWIGGFPYEVATFESLCAYVEAHGFSLINAKRTTSWGCNELAFRRGAGTTDSGSQGAVP